MLVSELNMSPTQRLAYLPRALHLSVQTALSFFARYAPHLNALHISGKHDAPATLYLRPSFAFAGDVTQATFECWTFDAAEMPTILKRMVSSYAPVCRGVTPIEIEARKDHHPTHVFKMGNDQVTLCPARISIMQVDAQGCMTEGKVDFTTNWAKACLAAKFQLPKDLRVIRPYRTPGVPRVTPTLIS